MKEALDYFSKMSKRQDITPTSVKNIAANDFTDYDAEFILSYCNSKTKILDLASGSGLTLNKIYQKVAKITAVEPFESFTKFIVRSPNVEIYNETLSDFEPKEKYDILSFFGIMQFFTEDEALKIYKKYNSALKSDGKIIIKNQFGVNEDVIVSGYSEELKTEYFSHYRHLDKEISLLIKAGYSNVKIFDIYPPECNRWKNTHFYAIVAEKL